MRQTICAGLGRAAIVWLGLSIVILWGTDCGAIERQRALNWCWAACVQDILASNDIYATQEQVAARLDGWPRNRPASSAELVVLLRSYGLRAFEVFRPGTPMELYSALASGWKLVAFVRPSAGPVGHFIVLEGFDENGNVLVSDPAFGTTRPESLLSLYDGWRWMDTVSVLPIRPFTASAPKTLPELSAGWMPSDEATKCFEQDIDSLSIQWQTTVMDPTVSFSLKYKNRCDRPVGCRLIAAVGNRLPEDSDSWVPYSYKEFNAAAGAYGSAQISGRLKWDPARPSGTVPAIRFAGDRSGHLELAACRFTGPSIASGSFEGVTRSSFLTFAGIPYGANEESVRRRFGTPESVVDRDRGNGKTARYLEYAGGDLRVGLLLPDDHVSVIDVQSTEAVEFLRKAGVTDPKLGLLGKNRDSITNLLGRPDDISSDVYLYGYSDNSRTGDVSFSVYDFNGYKCSEIDTQWYYGR